MMVSRRAFVGSAAAAVALSTVRQHSLLGQPGRPPNFMLIVADDLGAQLSCLGTVGFSTPHIDGLAKEGVLFRHAFCAFPSCSPSRTSMLTGLYPHSHGTTLNVFEFLGPRLPADWPPAQRRHNESLSVRPAVPTLVEALKSAGYRTGITRKFHMSPHGKFPFDEWIRSGSPQDLGTFVEQCGNRPFFLIHNIPSPHRPFQSHIRQAGRAVVDPQRVKVPDYLPDTPLMRSDWAQYLTAIEITDDQLGGALEALRKSGKRENTIVIFTGDNGPSFHRGKYSAYDLGLRVPLIAAGPGVQQGVRSEELAGHIDLMPTVLDYAGIALPKLVHGLSLRPALQEKLAAKGRQFVFGEVHFGFGPGNAQDRAASDGRVHYIRRVNPDKPHKMCADNYEKEPWGNHSYEATVVAKDQFPLQYELLSTIEGTPPREELFDLQKDPWCMRDVMGDPQYAAQLERMRKALDQWIEETDDEAFRQAR